MVLKEMNKFFNSLHEKEFFEKSSELSRQWGLLLKINGEPECPKNSFGYIFLSLIARNR